MTEYKVQGYIGNYYVFVDNIENGGPYDTEAKAKRRIRDLKRKEENDAMRLDTIRRCRWNGQKIIK